jgi:hypothetical protein
MSRPIDDDLPAILARAFVQAWQGYYLPGRSDAISEEIARPTLAKHLVAMAKEGLNEEAALAEAGLRHLNSLTAGPNGSGALLPNKSDGLDVRSSELPTLQSRGLHLRSDGSRARFLKQWRISWG